MASSSEKIEGILKRVRDENISVIRIWFIDIIGQIKGFAITPRELEHALSHGLGFDGSSIEGFARIHESDLMAHPDPDTFTLLPDGGSYKSARLICDLKTPEGEPFAGDTRDVLKKNLKKAADLGYKLFVGPELEYFVFKNNKGTEMLDQGGYFDASIQEAGTGLRQKSIFALEQMGIHVEYSHHEVAPSQHEIDLRYTEALKMADQCIAYKFLIKEITQEAGYYATFMPKPIAGMNGNGMHVHQSLFKGDSNAFFDKDAPYYLSQNARHYMAGLLKYVCEMTSILNQTVNSYKRLVGGYEAPVNVCWGQMNRSTLVRIPRIREGFENSTRLELRSADPVANPYLAFSVMLAAGLKGMEDKLEPPEAMEDDIFKLSPAELAERNIKTLPEDLNEAVNLTEGSSLVREALGDHVFEKFIENKRIEWDQWRQQVTDYELRRYLPVL
jgi:glutamine synthetase